MRTGPGFFCWLMETRQKGVASRERSLGAREAKRRPGCLDAMLAPGRDDLCGGGFKRFAATFERFHFAQQVGIFGLPVADRRFERSDSSVWLLSLSTRLPAFRGRPTLP